VLTTDELFRHGIPKTDTLFQHDVPKNVSSFSSPHRGDAHIYKMENTVFCGHFITHNLKISPNPEAERLNALRAVSLLELLLNKTSHRSP